MPVGRPRQPMQEKILNGSRIRKDQGDSLDVKAKLALPPCPTWLNAKAKKYWHTIGHELVALGLLSNIDGDVFAVHCDNVIKYAEVSKKLDSLDDWIAETPNGFEVQSALCQIRNMLQKQLIVTAREFGMTPSGRSNIKLDKPQQGDLFSPFAEFGNPQ